MDDKKLQEIWDAMMKEAFETFIDKNIGWEEGTKARRPACFGTGDDHDWCYHCSLQSGC
jgi:hypothetical protein